MMVFSRERVVDSKREMVSRGEKKERSLTP